VTVRYGVLADIHANPFALAAALTTLEAARVDRFLCLGDIVGFGPHPNECVRRIAELDAVTVAGNHDLIAVGRRSPDGAGALARRSLEWTRERLEPASRRFLEGLPVAALPEPGIVMTHGALGDPGTYVRGPREALAQLARLRSEHPGARLLLVGHTHHPMAVGESTGTLARHGRRVALPAGDRILLNPGSVGQSRGIRPHGSVLVLDTGTREAHFHTVRYDVAACRRALEAHGLPARSHHRRPSPRAWARRARRALRG
jgi:predicted phosphodiesterase